MTTMLAHLEARANPPRLAVPPKFQNGEEWHLSLGAVPFERILFNPWPGTATEADLIQLADQNRFAELIDGTLVEKTVGFDESELAVFISTAIKNFIRSSKLGFVAGEGALLRMQSGQVRIPDVSFTARTDVPDGKKPAGAVKPMPPTLAVEVFSEANTQREMNQKIEQYFASGSKLIWIVYPKTKTVDVFERGNALPAKRLNYGDVLDGGNVLPGFTINLKEMFDDVEE